MAYENIIVETHGRVGLIKLNRPQALNALNSALIGELSAAMTGLRACATRLHCSVKSPMNASM